MKLSNEELALHDTMAQKLPELIEEYFKRPEISSVGVSLKIVNDELTPTLSYTFGVKKKLPLSKVSHPIPSAIFGCPTDVIEFEVQPNHLADSETIVEASRKEKTDPLIGGISISANGEIVHGGKEIAGSGTLGVMVNKKNDDNPYMMTCAHVLVGTTTKLDSDVCQQSKWETTLNYCHDCASLKSYYHQNVSFQRGSRTIDSWLDCAIARKGWFRNATIGKVYGVGSIIGGFAVIDASIIGKEVCKSGITTEITTGNITSITTSLRLDNFDGTEVIGNNLTMIRGKAGRFSNSGDSGSAIFTTDDSMLVGILGGSTVSGDQAFGSPADAILSKWPDLNF
ncbi:hypothetical protein IQ37_09900 [Chryseobacterium piperi]|uniref:Peptidase S1 domain-containing protein n=1 Tax=Chryseobacterium piperi TaxID=558152 RepID=A0A086BIC2_9FLAO|nr:hypothetical protein [Chryseobacterium piperi]ASW72997.1 hypothetical protein CJF12_00970 [Chryseobacterium piperi]KFF28686.1 hypothetical protein IQ37_09900 [Chryseobacterium piperi]